MHEEFDQFDQQRNRVRQILSYVVTSAASVRGTNTLIIPAGPVIFHSTIMTPTSDIATESQAEPKSYIVHEAGTERFLVAERQLAHGYVVLDSVRGSILDHATRHTIQISDCQHLYCPSDIRFLNHSCEPNCKLEIEMNASGQVSSRIYH